MGRKDAGGIHGAPVDNYRKQIGKQDYKKEKKSLKEAKKASDLRKSATPVKDTVTIVLSGLFIVMGLYFALYWYLKKDDV